MEHLKAIVLSSKLGRSDCHKAAKPAGFTLYPTKNIYNFILLDQEDGSAWQVQWGEEEHRTVLRDQLDVRMLLVEFLPIRIRVTYGFLVTGIDVEYAVGRSQLTVCC